jgi:hypothetical protein
VPVTNHPSIYFSLVPQKKAIFFGVSCDWNNDNSYKTGRFLAGSLGFVASLMLSTRSVTLSRSIDFGKMPRKWRDYYGKELHHRCCQQPFQ